MENIKVKICGLQRREDILAVNQIRPDYIGFVFAPSRRKVEESTARELKELLHSSIKVSGVFVNESIQTIVNLCKNGIVDIIQLHGDEGEGYIRELKDHVSNPIIKGIRVRGSEDIIRGEGLPCEYLLLDTYQEQEYGGSGQCFDWSVIPRINKPYFLAGGLHSGNVIEAIRKCQPYGVDVSSGVENDGYKDLGKIQEFVKQVLMIKH